MSTVISTDEVHDFVARVRDHLCDLTEEEREELVGGLEGDMGELVDEDGLAALPDPSAYARELRAAAGFSPVGEIPRTSSAGERVMSWLDRMSGPWKRWVETGDHLGLPAFVTSLRPVWWVVRGLCATVLLVELTTTSQGVFGFTGRRAAAAVLLALLSVGFGYAWMHSHRMRRTLSLRLLVAALNLLALALVPVMADRFLVAHSWSGTDVESAVPAEGLALDGAAVENVYPYDAQGHPLTGVQLIDQDGRRLAVDPLPDHVDGFTIPAPWMNGRTELFSVFPLPQQRLDPDTGDPVGTPALGTPPFASLPPVTLTGVRPSVLVPAPRSATAAEKAGEKRRERPANR